MRLLIVLAGLVLGGLVGIPWTHAQPQGPDCPYLDAYGECTTERPFSPREPQRISIFSEPPGARVWVDGKPVGRTPIKKLPRKLVAGKHRFRFVAPYHITRVEQRRVLGSGPQRVYVTLAPFPRVSIRDPGDGSSVGGIVWVDDLPMGEVPWQGLLRPGRHELRVEQPGFVPWKTGVDLNASEEYIFQPRLRTELPTLTISSDLVGVKTVVRRVDDQSGAGQMNEAIVAKTPFQRQLPQGTYSITLEVEPGEVFTKTVTLEARDLAFNESLFPRSEPYPRTPIESDMDVLEERCESSTRQSDAISCLEFGWRKIMKLYGETRAPQREAARAIRKSCDMGVSLACEAFGWYARQGRPGFAEPRYPGLIAQSWRTWYTRACTSRYKRACYRKYLPEALDERNDPSQPYRDAYKNSLSARIRPKSVDGLPASPKGYFGIMGTLTLNPTADSEPYFVSLTYGGGFNIAQLSPSWALMVPVGFDFSINTYLREDNGETERANGFMFGFGGGLGVMRKINESTYIKFSAAGSANWQSAPERVLFSIDPRATMSIVYRKFGVDVGAVWASHPALDDQDVTRTLMPIIRVGYVNVTEED